MPHGLSDPSGADSNPRPQAPEACALSWLGYPPMLQASDSRMVELKASTIRPFVLHESEILEYGFWLRKEGYSEHTIFNDLKKLRRLDRHCSTLEPEAVKRFVANQNWNNGGKQAIHNSIEHMMTNVAHFTYVLATATVSFIPTIESACEVQETARITYSSTVTSSITQSSTNIVPAYSSLGLTDAAYGVLSVLVIGIFAFVIAWIALKSKPSQTKTSDHQSVHKIVQFLCQVWSRLAS